MAKNRDVDRAELVYLLQGEVLSSLGGYKHFHRKMAQELLPEGPMGAFAVLMALRTLGEVNGQALALHLSLDKGMISRYLQSLLAAGLVESTPDSEDGRSFVWSLSGVTIAKLNASRESQADSWQCKLKAWDEEKIALLVELLRELNQALDS